MSETRLRVNDIVERFFVSRKTVYNAINSGRLTYQIVTIKSRQVRVFNEADVQNAFPRGIPASTSEEIKVLKEEVAALKNALAELKKTVALMGPHV